MNRVNSHSGSALLRGQHHEHCRGYYYYYIRGRKHMVLSLAGSKVAKSCKHMITRQHQRYSLFEFRRLLQTRNVQDIRNRSQPCYKVRILQGRQPNLFLGGGDFILLQVDIDSFTRGQQLKLKAHEPRKQLKLWGAKNNPEITGGNRPVAHPGINAARI